MSIAASSLSFIDGSVLNVALPAIRDATQASAAEVGWVVNAYNLPLAALILLGGALGDHYGRRLWLVIGTSLFGAASLLCALTSDPTALLAGRALQGIGAALLLPNSLALLNGAYSGEARGRAVGIWAAAGAIAAAIAPLIGGWLVDHAGWPSIFYINVPIVALAVMVALTRVAESSERSKARLDFSGAALATLGLGAATYGLTLWSSDRAFSVTAGVALAIGAALMVAFVLVEKRLGDRAMIPLDLFANRCFSSLNLTTFLLYGAFGGVMLLVPYVLIEGGGYSPIQGGLALLPLSILIGLGSPIMGKLAERIGPRLPLTIGPGIVAAGMILAIRIGQDQSFWSHVFPAVTLMALGMAILVAPLTASVLGSVEEQQTGMASGFNSALSRTGGLIAVALLGAVLADSGQAIFGPFRVALIVMAVVAALGGIAAWIGLAAQKPKKT
ncbi:MFS transporter [Sphingomonas rhizophila]|uniref:MFS transporter n=1 Tax=Sphingomonas rhizophila TaxID=2071607 RepID=UPI001FEC0705|nr:MFS transporter [Sphingomonas rhizophila]